jgi:uncharacterized protein (DUF1015 family)
MQRIATPPYDVITEKDRLEYEKAHPKNVVRLILPGEAGLAGDGTFYSGAASLLRRWCEEGTLRRESAPSFYPYRQTYRGPDGILASRLGFLGALVLEESGAGDGPLPHEKTLDGPRRDRTRLISACRANLSPIFLIHPDGTGRVGAVLGGIVREEPLFRFSDREGVLHELWRMADPDPVQQVRSALETDWTLIADGHHRYESALNVVKELPGEEGARYVLAFFCSLQDRGFRIFPIHRLINPRPAGAGAGLERLLRERLPCEILRAGSGAEEVLARLREAGERTFAALLPGGSRLLFRAVTAERNPAGALPEDFDTVVLEREILGGILGITPEAVAAGAVAYTPDAGEALRRVESGEAEAAFLLNPLRMDAVVRAARSGLRLPQKSTYFYPKVFTGLVIRPF